MNSFDRLRAKLPHQLHIRGSQSFSGAAQSLLEKKMHLENTNTFPTSFCFPLSWGISNKIKKNISQHDNQRCGVAFRLAYSWHKPQMHGSDKNLTTSPMLHISTVFKHMCEYQVTLGRTSWFQPNPPIIPYIIPNLLEGKSQQGRLCSSAYFFFAQMCEKISG